MTAALDTHDADTAARDTAALATTTFDNSTLKITQARVVRSEWTKFRSVRSTVWTLLSAVILMVGLGALFAGLTSTDSKSFGPGSGSTFDAVTTSLNGILFAVLALGVLAVLLISGEYSTGMIRSSLTAVPRRLPVLWGKLAVYAGVVFTVSIVTTFVTFFVGQALLGTKDLGVSITSPDALRSVIGAALYMTVAGMIGVTLGALLRNSAAAISTFVGVFFLLPLLSGLLPSSITGHFLQYLPSNAGGVLYGETVAHGLAPWTGFAVLCGYAVVLIGAAAWRLQREDA